MLSPQMRKAVMFFAEHAGYCTPPGKEECALELAKAEQWGRENNVFIDWVPDPEPWDGDGPAPKELWGCKARITEGNKVKSASLWGIGDPSPEYMRVVEAELCRELQCDFFEEIAKYIQQL